jgi:thiol-disulfide isomerase/thioredoxin
MKKVLIGLVTLLALGAVYFAFLGNSEQSTDEATVGSLSEASQDMSVPTELQLPGMTDLEGNRVNFDHNKLVFVNVWATWCGPCNMEMPSIQELYGRFKDNDKIAFYVISDEDSETVVPFVQRKKYDLPLYLYQGRYPAELEGNAIPRTYIISKGKVLVSEVGARNWNDPAVVEMIEQELAAI